MSYWVEADIEVIKQGKLSVKRAFEHIIDRYEGYIKQDQNNPNMYHLNYVNDGVHVAKELKEVIEEAKNFGCRLSIHVSLYIF